jgi:hypothetical protein
VSDRDRQHPRLKDVDRSTLSRGRARRPESLVSPQALRDPLELQAQRSDTSRTPCSP